VTIGAVSVRDAAGLVPIGERWVRDASNTLVQVFASVASVFTAQALPDTVFGAASRPGTATVYTNQTSVTVTGGRAPYTYAWSTDPSFSVTAINSPATTFRAGVDSGDTLEADFFCTVTDAAGRTAVTNSVHASVTNYGRDLR
jgi:hypothetical protein